MAQHIYEVLSELLASKGVPLSVIAVCGEILVVEARLCSNDGVKSAKSVDQLSAFLDDHDALIERSRSVVRRFLKTKDDDALLRDLSEIRQALIALG